MSEKVHVRPLQRRERDAARAFLMRRPRENLFLLDLASQGGRAQPGEMRAELVAGWRDHGVVGVASLRPSLCLASGIDGAMIDGLLPACESLGSGLVKSEGPTVDRLWKGLQAAGRRALVDRREIAHELEPGGGRLRSAPQGVVLRRAQSDDLEALVFAARASLREEQRPDPYEGDPEGFRRWVHGRVGNALVAEVAGRVSFVAYADVRRAEGWLLQGVYTWPAFRRRGLAAAGVSQLCEQAFAAGATHVQLAVVEGNRPGEALYERLGFRRFATLRTILFR
ncbi:MAG: GNAT family N-acetyltransferase [Myxococcota bacterium]